MKIATIKRTLVMITITILASASIAAITPASDTFETNTESFPSWSVVLSPTNTAIIWDAAQYDFSGIPPTATGDGLFNDHGLRMDTKNAITGDEAVGLTLNGTMDENEIIIFSGNAYNDNSSAVSFYAQLWNLTDNALLTQSSLITVSGQDIPQDFSIDYKATESDVGDTLQIRLLENADNTARDIFIDNFSISSTPEALFAYEGFETTAVNGTDVTAVRVTGSGFSSYTNTHGNMDIAEGLTYMDSSSNALATTGKSGGMNPAVGGTQNLQLALDSTIDSGTIYMSFLTDIKTFITWNYSIGLLNSTAGGASTGIDANMSVGMRSSSSTWRIHTASTQFTSGGTVSTGIHFVVSSVNIDTGDVTLWLDPTNLTDVAGSATATITANAGGALPAINGFALSLGSDEAGTIDEIRIGNTLDIVVPLVDPSVQTLTWNFSGDPSTIETNTPQYDYTSDQIYVASNAVPNTLAFNGGSESTDYLIKDKGPGHESSLFFKTINPQGQDVGIYLQKMDFRVDNMNLTNKTLVSWSFDILGYDQSFEGTEDIIPTNWTVRINYGNYSENINVSESWFINSSSVEAQTFDFVDDDSTWTTVTGSYEIAVNQAGSAGSIQIRQPVGVGGYTSGGGIYLDNIQVTIESITPVYDNALEEWAAGFGLYGNNALPGNDAEPDGLDNLMEYALGGDPTTDDASTVRPVSFTDITGATNWLYHVHNERTDDPTLTFTLGTETDLVNAPAWNTNDVFNVGESAEVGGFKTVTNRTEMTDSAKFIRLNVEQN